MTDLSPQARAVLDAFGRHPLHGDHVAESLVHGALPAALRAAAEHVVRNRVCRMELNLLANELETFGSTDR
jgi:hypothetical protein